MIIPQQTVIIPQQTVTILFLQQTAIILVAGCPHPAAVPAKSRDSVWAWVNELHKPVELDARHSTEDPHAHTVSAPTSPLIDRLCAFPKVRVDGFSLPRALHYLLDVDVDGIIGRRDKNSCRQESCSQSQMFSSKRFFPNEVVLSKCFRPYQSVMFHCIDCIRTRRQESVSRHSGTNGMRFWKVRLEPLWGS